MRSPMHGLAFARKPEIAVVVFGAFLSYACGGCLSNRYAIPHDELVRLAELPPEQRGQNVHVVQDVGERRGEAIETGQPAPPAYGPDGYGAPPPEGYVEGGPEPQVGVGVIIPIVPGPGPIGGPGPGRGFGGRPGVGPGGSAPGVGGRPFARAPRGTAAPAPAPSKGKVGSGGGKDDVIVFLIVVAVVATIGLVATEGVRYDGEVAMYPWQGIHLKDASGQEREVPLAQLTPADAASAHEATVMDDEGWGLMRLGRGPLDRKGFAFKIDLGGFHSWNTRPADGFALGVHLGYFPHHRFGLLAGWAFASGSGADGNTYTRNDLALEAQLFPVSLGRFHPGLFAHGGVAYANTGNQSLNGSGFGGGILFELGLTARLALSFRADHTLAQVANAEAGWSSVSTFTVGLAIY